ncbi:MAG: hypothetical protein ABI053_05220 [Lacisediminihabitans sp.]
MGTILFGPGGPAGFEGLIQGGGSPPSVEDLVVQPLSESQWRVSDRRYSENDACSLLGFIEEKDGTFELTQLEHGFEWFYFRTLGAAVTHFTRAPISASLLDPESLKSSGNVDLPVIEATRNAAISDIVQNHAPWSTVTRS